MRSRKPKCVGRIVSPYEKKMVEDAKKGTVYGNKVQYSNKAQRKVPTALHGLYGLPMRDHRKTIGPSERLSNFLNQFKK